MLGSDSDVLKYIIIEFSLPYLPLGGPLSMVRGAEWQSVGAALVLESLILGKGACEVLASSSPTLGICNSITASSTYTDLSHLSLQFFCHPTIHESMDVSFPNELE